MPHGSFSFPSPGWQGGWPDDGHDWTTPLNGELGLFMKKSHKLKSAVASEWPIGFVSKKARSASPAAVTPGGDGQFGGRT